MRFRFKGIAWFCAALLSWSPTAYARADARRADGYDVLKSRVELQLAGGPHAETQAKVNEAVLRYEKLLDEADELERQANLARSEQGP